jgi:hypothetical protein
MVVKSFLFGAIEAIGFAKNIPYYGGYWPPCYRHNGNSGFKNEE